MKSTTEDVVLKLLKNIEISKTVVGIDNLRGRFLKDGTVILAKPVTKICNLSIKSGIFCDPSNLSKLKPPFKKSWRMVSSNYITILLLPLISKILRKLYMTKLLIIEPNMTFHINISPVLEQNIQMICIFHTWMMKFLRALIMAS